MSGTPDGQIMLDQFPAYRYQHVGPGIDVYDPSVPSDGELAFKVLERTNPSVPVVDVPAMIGEFALGNIPLNIRSKGISIIRKIANVNLKYQFEIKPLVSDLLKCLQLMDDVQGRMKTLNTLHTKGKLRKAAKVYKKGRKYSRWVSMNSDFGVGISGEELIQDQVDIWGYTTWYLDDPLSMVGMDPFDLASRLVSGAYLNFDTVWELIPWSWFVDWFTNVGSILNATRNELGCTPGLVYLCEHRKSELKSGKVSISPHGVTMSPYHSVRETKERRLATPYFSASLPFLNDKQVSILGSIAISRSRYGSLN